MTPDADPGRPATADDVDAICAGLPGAELGTSWGDRPTWKVRDRGFVIYRSPQRDAVDPATGEEYDDLVVINTPTAAEKEALVADPSLPFFTTPHFGRSAMVLVQQSRLGEISYGELREVLVEAWATRATKRAVREYLDA